MVYLSIFFTNNLQAWQTAYLDSADQIGLENFVCLLFPRNASSVINFENPDLSISVH